MTIILNNSNLFNFIFRSANCFFDRIIHYDLMSPLSTKGLVIIDQFSALILNYNEGDVVAAV